MTLELSLAPDNSLVASTAHGLKVRIAGGAEGYTQLVRMLQAQAKVKIVPPRPPGLAGGDFHYVLAEWERVGPVGEGKVRKPPLTGIRHRLPDEARPGDFARKYDARGRVVEYSAADDLEPL